MDKNVQDYLYILGLEYKEMKKLKIKYTLMCLLMGIITFSIGYLDAQCMKNPIVLICYTFSIIAVAILLVGCFNIIGMVDFMVYKTYKKAFLWVMKMTKALFVIYGICLGSSIVSTFVKLLNKNSKSILIEVTFIIGITVCLVINYFLFKYHADNIKLIYKKPRGNNNE